MKKIIILLAVSLHIVLPTIIHAQTVIGGYTVSPPVSLRQEFTQRGALAAIISTIFLILLQIIGLVGFLFILWSGFQFLTSKGDPKGIEAAKARLTYSIVGLVVIGLSYGITRFVLTIFGINTP